MSAPGQGNQRSRNMGISTLPPSSNQGQEDSWFKYIVAASVIGTCIGNMFVARKMRSIGKWTAPTKDAHKRKAGGYGFHPSPSNFYANEHINASHYRGPHTRQHGWDGKTFNAPYPNSATNAHFKNHLKQKSPLELDQEFIVAYKKWSRTIPPFESNSPYRPYFVAHSSTWDGLALQHHLNNLDLQQDRVSSVTEIKRAFQHKAKLLHPDSNHTSNSSKNGKNGDSKNDEESKRREFTKVSESYRFLLKKMEPLQKAIQESHPAKESNPR